MQDDFLFITSKKKLYKVSVTTICFIEAMDDHVKIRLKDSKFLITRMTMKVMIAQLDPKQFIRVHRSYIVPLKDIQAVGAAKIVVNGMKISMGKKYAEEVLKVFTQPE